MLFREGSICIGGLAMELETCRCFKAYLKYCIQLIYFQSRVTGSLKSLIHIISMQLNIYMGFISYTIFYYISQYT